MASPFIGTYTSFSGSDLVVSFGPTVIGELQQISYAVQREKVPVFTLGSPNPRSFSRGKRGIAGSLVFAAFDRDGLLEEMKNIWEQIAPRAMFTAAGNIAKGKSEDFGAAMELTRWNQSAALNAASLYTANKNSIQAIYNAFTVDQVKGYLVSAGISGLTVTVVGALVGATAVEIIAAATVIAGGTIVVDALTKVATNLFNQSSAAYGFSGVDALTLNAGARQSQSNDVSKVTVYAPPGFKTITKENIQYVDQLPPFDITLTFANEYGQAAFQKFYDVEILNEASGVSVDSVVMERNYTWVGRNLSPLYKGVYSRDSDGTILQMDTVGNRI